MRQGLGDGRAGVAYRNLARGVHVAVYVVARDQGVEVNHGKRDFARRIRFAARLQIRCAQLTPCQRRSRSYEETYCRHFLSSSPPKKKKKKKNHGRCGEPLCVPWNRHVIASKPLG